MKTILIVLVIIFATFAGKVSNAQITITTDDYQRADLSRRFNDLVFNGFISPTWIGNTHNFWYEVRTRRGREYFLVNVPTRNKKPAFDQERLAETLGSKTGQSLNAFELPISEVAFNEEMTEMMFVADSIRWKLLLQSNDLEKIERIQPERRERRHWATVNEELDGPPVISPDSVWVGFIQDFNVHIRRRETGEEFQLSFDGSKGEYYSSYLHWSPDSRFLAVNKIRPHTPRYLYFVESTPDNQLRPKPQKLEYLRPGDAVQIRKPSLFNISEKKQIHLNTQPFEHQFSLTNLQWRINSSAFTFEFNQRGHQVYQVVEVNTEGRVRVIIDERSPTFIDYSSKRFRHDVNDGRELIWASERDGWNHLYLIDGQTGRIKNQITRGEWVVRSVVHVNENQRFIIFRGAGRHKDEDPYLVRYYRVNFDGRGLKELTPEQANHRAFFSSDYRYFVNSYSRIDLAPVTVLRQADNIEILMTLEQADISELLAQGWRQPEVFSALGRDGKTRIWGNIYRPVNFDPNIKYPIIEAIYAGPHSAFVPKSFRPFIPRVTCLAELGFIVVQIDGMGTSQRSKAFHDVAWQNLHDAGFPDRILWMKAAAEKYPYMDIERVGIFGTSAGGQSAMGALLFHPDFYKAAVALNGCHDNRLDKIWWNEQWMGYPIGPHYKESSNVVNAHKLQGRLLLMVGELDDNVDPASTLQVVDALINANKDFEFIMFPGLRHGLRSPYIERRIRDFFVRHLHNLQTPDWNRK
ncbi:MAG TPA: prolyl oligopeptidase family serine peptidase [Bacteroidales bacterium]|nr:prolyl oligopeptidase family serine peptidase [Bacteroidales bacterium]